MGFCGRAGEWPGDVCEGKQQAKETSDAIERREQHTLVKTTLA